MYIRHKGEMQMKATIKSGKGKLIISAIFFFAALICLGLAIFILVASATGMEIVDDEWEKAIELALGFAALIFLSFLFNLSYRNHVIYPGAFSTTMYVLCIALFVLLVFAIGTIRIMGGGNTKKVTVKDKNGDEYKLKQTEAGSDEYEDQYGNKWRAKDDGETFRRIDKIVKDEDGKKHTLTPRFPGSETYYRDENGDDWTTHDYGKTFERDK